MAAIWDIIPKTLLILLILVALGEMVHGGLFKYTRKNPRDPSNERLVHKVLKNIRQDRRGIKIKEFWRKKNLLDWSYKVTYEQKGKICTTHFRGKIFWVYSIAVPACRPMRTEEPEQTTSTTEAPTTPSTTEQDPGTSTEASTEDPGVPGINYVQKPEYKKTK